MNNQHSFLYAALFLFFTALSGATLLMGTNTLLKERIQTNILNEKYRSLFALARVDLKGKSAAALARLYATSFTVLHKGTPKEHLVYRRGTPQAVHIYPMRGLGFWGPIHAYIAFDAGFKQIQGVVVVRQEETPGLGAEITKRYFLDRFVGKPLEQKGVLLRLVRSGEKRSPMEIDGITGATETTMRMNTMLQRTLKRALAQRERGRHAD
ncbi:MAG: hypothetical protein CSA54_06370 [Gammaproteobacteria bacterium]|nr:MAG: hypothetical protein CSA54_06370 [Gammaproteobacteria bacterium]